MKSTIIIVSMFFVVLASSCQTKNAENKTNINETISADVFEEKLKTNVQLIDVRTAEEFANGHLTKAHNIDVNSDDWNSKIQSLDKKKPILVYCKSGKRSANAAEKLTNNGFATVYNLEGGITAWQAAGKSIENMPLDETNNELSVNDYNELVKNENYVLVDFHAKWCGPCKELSPILEKISVEKKDKLKLIKIDADENQSLLIAKGVDGIPYLELFKNGKIVWSNKGFMDEKALLKVFKSKGLE